MYILLLSAYMLCQGCTFHIDPSIDFNQLVPAYTSVHVINPTYTKYSPLFYNGRNSSRQCSSIQFSKDEMCVGGVSAVPEQHDFN